MNQRRRREYAVYTACEGGKNRETLAEIEAEEGGNQDMM